jgi:CubicO group peptidase (beta-lactamase class C family)
MIGTVVLQLVDEGKLALNDKLSKYYPDYPKADSITIAMLCNMSSGIYNYTEDEGWANTLISDPTKVWPLRNWLISDSPVTSISARVKAFTIQIPIPLSSVCSSKALLGIP